LKPPNELRDAAPGKRLTHPSTSLPTSTSQAYSNRIQTLNPYKSPSTVSSANCSFAMLSHKPHSALLSSSVSCKENFKPSQTLRSPVKISCDPVQSSKSGNPLRGDSLKRPPHNLPSFTPTAFKFPSNLSTNSPPMRSQSPSSTAFVVRTESTQLTQTTKSATQSSIEPTQPFFSAGNRLPPAFNPKSYVYPESVPSKPAVALSSSLSTALHTFKPVPYSYPDNLPTKASKTSSDQSVSHSDKPLPKSRSTSESNPESHHQRRQTLRHPSHDSQGDSTDSVSSIHRPNSTVSVGVDGADHSSLTRHRILQRATQLNNFMNFRKSQNAKSSQKILRKSALVSTSVVEKFSNSRGSL
jgi:hypothetical protein